MGHCALRVPVALACALAATAAGADAKPPSEPGAAADERVRELLATVADGPTSAREEAVAELLEQKPAIEALEAFLGRERDASDEQRRAVLARIGASVPDEDGRFRKPPQQSEQEIRDDDAFDWLAQLYELRERPGLGSVMADVAAVRALAATDEPDAARAILDFAFSEHGLVIRDECGRYLRKMAPQSIPALIRGAGDRKQPAPKRRYARYQLGRLDREDPPKALDAAAGEDLKVEILRAYADTLWREAVFTVIDLVDHESPPVRAAARETWLTYVTGPPPPPAPERKLRLAGGRLSDEPKALFRNARELANHALRLRYAEVLGERPPRSASLGDLSQDLFAHYDSERRRELEVAFEEAAERAAAGDLDEAVAEFNRILVQDPDFERRAEMVDAYLARGAELREAGEVRAAAAAFAKAYMLDPEGPRASEARTAQHEAHARALAERAADDEHMLPPPPPPEPTSARSQRPWLLFSGIGVGLVAVLLGAIGIVARRRQSQGG